MNPQEPFVYKQWDESTRPHRNKPRHLAFPHTGNANRKDCNVKQIEHDFDFAGTVSRSFCDSATHSLSSRTAVSVNPAGTMCHLWYARGQHDSAWRSMRRFDSETRDTVTCVSGANKKGHFVVSDPIYRNVYLLTKKSTQRLITNVAQI